MTRLFAAIIVSIFTLSVAIQSNAQQTARMTSGGTGYLEKLPPDYSTNPTKKYPLLFFLHGAGETGSGSPTDLEKVKLHGPPYLIEHGSTMCFIVNGVEECFIVISPQLGNQGGWWTSILNDVFNYVLTGPQNYRIDLSRVYLTGLSLGGWGVYIGAGDPAVPDIFAAAAPVSAFSNGNGCTLSSRKIAMWGFHGESDGTIPYGNGLSAFNNTVFCTTPSPMAELKWTSYPGKGHDIWENFAYRTDNNLHTPNLYQWLLTKSKSNLPNLVITNPAPVCSPATVDITAAAVTAGSTTGMTFTYWTDASATNVYATANAATNGTYYIKGTTASGSSTKPVVATVNPSPSLLITNPASICPTATTNLTLASITAGSTSGLTLSYWTNSNATTVLSNPATVSVGTYYIKATTASGCSSIKPVTVGANPVPTISITNPVAVCAPGTIDLTAGAVTAGSSSGLSFSYWTDASATISLATPAIVLNGIYYIRGANSFGCFDIKPVTATVNALPNLVITNQTGCAPATIDLTAESVKAGSSTGLTYSYWSDGAASVALLNPASVSTGTYYIKAKNAASCSIIKPVVVTTNAIPSVAITNPPAICASATLDITAGFITAGSTPGLSFSYWTNLNATTSLTNPTTATIGTYYIKGTALSGCSSIKQIIVSANPTPTLSVTNPPGVCEPAAINLMATAVTAGSSSGLSLSYWIDASATSSLANPSSVSNGVYYIKGTNSFGCSDSKPVTATVNLIPNLTITDPTATCYPATIDLTTSSITEGSSSGSSYSYWMDAGATSTLLNPTSVETGTYYIKATNTELCSLVKPVSATVNPIPSLIITNPTPVCEPSSIDITTSSITDGSSAGLTLSYWADADATIPFTNPTTSSNGTYYIRGIDSFGCADIKPVATIVNAIPFLTITNPSAVCSPSTIDLTLDPITNGSSTELGYTYWNNAEATDPLTNPTAITSSNTYFIKATNAASCISVKPVNATINPLPDLIITNPDAVCAPLTIDLTNAYITAGSSTEIALSYWMDASLISALPNPSSVARGVYYINATNTVGCTTIKPVTLTVHDTPDLVITDPLAICEPANIDLTATSVTAGSSIGFDLSYWTNASASTVLANPTSASLGTYYIKALNEFGCSEVKSVNAIVKPMPIAIVLPAHSNLCGGMLTNISLSTSNTIPGGVDYSWTPTLVTGTVQGHSTGVGSSIAQKLTTNNIGGIVRYVIQSTSITGGCPGTIVTADVTINPVPDVAINTTASAPVICNGCSTYIVIKNPSNVSGTSFSWNTEIQRGNITGQSSGTGSIISQVLNKTGSDGIVRYIITPKTNNCQGNSIAYDVRINSSPTAGAGPDLTITLPINSAIINGTGKDIDGAIASYLWTKVSGPTSYKLENQTTPNLTVKDVIEGTYQFKLFVQDSDGAIGVDEMTLVVAPKTNIPPTASAGRDVNIKLPVNQVTFNGIAADTDGTIKSIKWTQLSGPVATINTFEYKLELSNLTEGNYTFRFSATDNSNATVSDDVALLVEPNDFIPTGTRKKFITPNGDQQNDLWELDSDISKFASCKLIILSNDGTKVFEANGYQNNWDGTHDGKPLPQDVYYYVLDCNGTKDSGSITIIR
jgi:gliding motility-associated-like protein